MESIVFNTSPHGNGKCAVAHCVYAHISDILQCHCLLEILMKYASL